MTYAGKQIEGGRTLADYNIDAGATLEVLGGYAPRVTNLGLQEKVAPTAEDIKQKVDYWQEAENASFDDDMEIVDPGAHSMHLELACDAVARYSEFKRCGGRYLRSDEHTWTNEPQLIKSLPVPPWMWDVIGTLSLERLPHRLGSLDDVLASLCKTSLILSCTVSSFYELEKRRLSNAFFNLLLRIPGSDVIEIVRIPITEIETIQRGVIGCIEQLSVYGNDEEILDITDIQATLWARIFALCQSLLERLHLRLEGVEPPIAHILALGRVTALLLDLALLSYSGSHGIRFDKAYLSNGSEAFEVNWEDTLFGFRCALARLACLDEFLDRSEVWAFELRSGASQWEMARNRPFSILTKMEDFADIWGPVYTVPGTPHMDKVRQYNVSKGIICRAGGKQPAFRNAIKCHWYNRPLWLRGLVLKFLPP